MKKRFLVIVGILAVGSTTIWKKIDNNVFSSTSKETNELIIKNISKQSIENLKPSIKSHFENFYFLLKENRNSIDVFNSKDNLVGKIRGNQITSSPGYSTKTFNELLDVKLLSKFTYKIESFIYKTGAKGRVNEISISSFPKSTQIKPRNPLRQGLGNLPKGGIKGVDVGGHLIANRLGGISEIINIVPMNRILNGPGGKWYKQEAFIANNKKYIKDLKIKLIYSSDNARPDYFQMTYKYKNELVVKSFENSKII